MAVAAMQGANQEQFGVQYLAPGHSTYRPGESKTAWTTAESAHANRPPKQIRRQSRCIFKYLSKSYKERSNVMLSKNTYNPVHKQPESPARFFWLGGLIIYTPADSVRSIVFPLSNILPCTHGQDTDMLPLSLFLTLKRAWMSAVSVKPSGITGLHCLRCAVLSKGLVRVFVYAYLPNAW